MQHNPETPRRLLSTARLYGQKNLERFLSCHIAVVGIGGVGSWVCEALARSGIGKLTMIDLDHIAESNINRQIHALDSTIGQAKVNAMAERIKQINHHCELNLIDDFLTPQNCTQLLNTKLDGIIDACDQFSTKLAIIDYAKQHKIPFITVGAAGGKQRADLTEIADLSQASHDPLLSKIRYTYRKRQQLKANISLKIPVVFSREAVTKPTQCTADVNNLANNLNCHGYGSAVAVTASFGFSAAGWILNKLCQTNQTL